MNKLGSDPKVKKTLVRSCERQVVRPSKLQVIRETNASLSGFKPVKSGVSAQKDVELSQPTLCSSVVLANYLYDVKNTPPTSSDNVNIDKSELSSKVTKKLNFHINSKIYKNLIELNATHEELKSRKEKRSTTSVSVKKDLEPDIEDFCQDEIEQDSPPKIPIIKPKTKPVTIVENSEIHRLVSSFEVL